MLEILKYIFSSFWIFLGVLIMIYAIGEIVCNMVTNVCKTILGSIALKRDKDIDLNLTDKNISTNK